MAYSEDEFVYESHRPPPPMDRAIRRMVLGAGGLSVAVIVVALAWSGVRATGFGPPPEIAPPATKLRVAPVNPGGLQVPEANVPIMSGDPSNLAAAQLAPAAQAPDIAQLDQAAGLTPPPAAAAPAPAAPAPAAPPIPASVQLAATADEAGAEAIWTSLQARHPALFAGKTPDLLPAVVNGQSVWRLRLGGFASTADAQAFCAQAEAQGTACTVAAF